MNKNILDSAEDKIQLLLSDIVSEDMDGDPIRFRYLKQQGNLNMAPRQWLREYCKIMQSGVVVNYPRLKPWACHSKFRADSSPAVSFRHGARSPKTDSTDDYRLIDATHNMIVCLLLFYARIPPTPALVPLPLHSLKGWASCGTPAEAGYVVRWQTSREVDPTGGDEVRIWTEDLNGTSLDKNCDFTVWDYPDGTVGEDFVKFLTWD